MPYSRAVIAVAGISALQQGGDSRSGYLQFGEGEHLFAEVFQGGADVINVRAVDNQEVVVALLVGVDAYRGYWLLCFCTSSCSWWLTVCV